MDKFILSIPLYNNSPKIYEDKWEKWFSKIFHIDENSYSINQISEFRSFSQNLNPRFYRYNDILGYAELYVDWRDILIHYCLNGDQRKRYNRFKTPLRRTKGKIYHSFGHVHGGFFKTVYNKSIRKAISDSLVEIEKQCMEWKVYVDIQPYMDSIMYFDFVGYLRKKNWLYL